MHRYPLHRQVHARCECCGVRARFTFTSTSDHVICKGCKRHQGDSLGKAIQRDRDHVGLWSSEVDLVREEFATHRAQALAAQERLTRQLEQIRLENDGLRQAIVRGFEAAAPADVQKILADKSVKEAEDQRDAAYRSRDHAYRGLWAVDDLHHEEETSEECSCGAASCPVLEAVGLVRPSLYDWENKQIDRARNGLDHGLPRDHPEYRDPRR